MSTKGDGAGLEAAQVTQKAVEAGTVGPRFALVVYHRDGTAVAPLEPDNVVVIGRVAPSDLVVPDNSLSRQHARFRLVGNEVMVEDLDSTNGTWVGGNSIKADVLRPGDAVVLGSVTAVVQGVGAQPQLGLDGHDRFVALLEREVLRARHSRRPFAVMMLRARGADKKLHPWAQTVPSALRAIDSVALYGGDTVEALLPECSASEALELAQSVLKAQGALALLCGISSYPEAATSPEQLIESCRIALQHASAAEPTAVAPSAVVSRRLGASTAALAGIVTRSAAMLEVLDMGRKVARGIIPVLVHGETGTGKELLSRFIHREGPRRDKPLVAVNCAAIPSQLVESTLFGHTKGAFTGADQAHAGVFESANGGTVLLDEIGELPPGIQAALLRVLESKTITRVGSTKEQAVDVRILAASHRDLEAMCKSGAFREDLFYRLNAVTLEIPALRERRDDVVPLAEQFLAGANASNGTAIRCFAPEAMAALERYDWPGNIRELRNAVERAVVIAEHDVIGLRDLPRRVRGASGEVTLEAPEAPPAATARLRSRGEGFRACMERIETQVVLEALNDTNGNQTEAARQLEMPRRTLVYKIRTLGIKRDD